MSHLNTAYWAGAHDAVADFEKQAQGNLGDPNFWGGGDPAMEMEQGGGAGQPASAEEAIGLLPAGTFQGLQTKVTPDGAKTVSMKVTPDALAAPEALQSLFMTGENTKVEIASPDLAASETSYRETAGSDLPLPGEAVPPGLEMPPVAPPAGPGQMPGGGAPIQ